jgi:hypothetical protein
MSFDTNLILRLTIPICIPFHKKELNEDKMFSPKQSKRIRLDKTAKADGDTWIEHVVYVDATKQTKRSYFKSEKTGKTLWDEPPSGAQNIILFSHRKK